MPPPQLSGQTLAARAARSPQIWEARQAARDQVVEQFDTVEDPTNVPIRQRDGGLAPARSFLDIARPREAAHDLDPQFPAQELGPEDVTRVEGGFRPTERVRRRGAAREFEQDTALGAVDPQEDLVPTAEGFGLAGPAQRELGAAQLDPQFPEVDIGPEDVERQGPDAFGLTPFAEREVAAEQLEDETPLDEVGPSQVRRAGDGFELRDAVIERNQSLF